MKYRSGGNSKIKREHSMIAGIENLLEILESWEEVISIIPGRINPVNKSHSAHLKIQYETITGLKCIALSGPAVQEVFIVTSDVDIFRMRLEAL